MIIPHSFRGIGDYDMGVRSYGDRLRTPRGSVSFCVKIDHNTVKVVTKRDSVTVTSVPTLADLMARTAMQCGTTFKL